MYCWVAPTVTVAVAGLTAILTRVGGGGVLTTRVPEPVLAWNVALMTALPALRPLARPVPGATLAIAGEADAQADFNVTSWEVPSA